MPIVINDPLKGRPREASRIPSRTSDVLTEQFAQTFEENPIAAGARWYELEQQKQRGPRIDANSAREQLKSAGLDGDLTVDDAGITQEALDTLMWRKKIEKRRQDVFSRAEGGFGQGAARLGVAAATTLADPISAGLNFVPVVGQARYAKWLAGARGLGGRVAVRAGVGAAEGAAGAAIVEPLIYASRTAEQADYDAVDSLMNVAFGGLLGTAMHTSVGTLGEVFARRMEAPRGTDVATATRQRIGPTFDAAAESAADIARAMHPEDFQATLRAAVGQAIEGRAVDVEGLVRVATHVPDEERFLVREITRALESREASLLERAGGADALIAGASRSSDLDAEIQRSVELRDQIAAEIAREPAGSARLTELRRQQDQAQQLLESRRAALQRFNQVRVAETDVEQLRYGRSSAKTLDDLVDALPTDQQAGFRRRIEEGRKEGFIRPRGARLAEPEAPPLPPPEPARVDDTAELDTYAEETLAADTRATDNTEDLLAAVKEEETFATQQLTELYARLGRELKSAEYDEVIEAAKNAERWSRTAELATVCLTSGRT